VCGSGIADRVWTTVGLERKLNPRLQVTDRDAFIEHTGKMLLRAPYFESMEKLNLSGAPLLGALPAPKPLSADEFAERMTESWIVDTRTVLSFMAAHVPGSVALWKAELATYAGWFLDYDKPILLLCDEGDIDTVVRLLIRMGFDQIEGFLAGGMLAWHRAGEPSQQINMVTVQELCHRLDNEQEAWILDVRSDAEVEADPIPNAHHIHIKSFPERMVEVPREPTVYVFCGTGVRSAIVASLLRRAGWNNMVVVLGGLAGWSSTSCPLPSS
jgi:hydroxyacylglutathione hydrolase